MRFFICWSILIRCNYNNDANAAFWTLSIRKNMKLWMLCLNRQTHKGGINMASIVQRNKSFSVVYTIHDGDKKKQKWETYHYYEEALRRKEQLEIIQQQER